MGQVFVFLILLSSAVCAANEGGLWYQPEPEPESLESQTPAQPPQQPEPAQQSLEKGKPVHSPEEFFTVSGVVLGRTKSSEVLRFGGRSSARGYPYIEFKGQNFWHHGQTYVYHMYLVRSDELPKEWHQLGFDIAFSFEEMSSFLKRMGFQLEVTEPPDQKLFGGELTFSAELKGRFRARDGRDLEIQIDFNYRPGTTATRGTVYSVTLLSSKGP